MRIDECAVWTVQYKLPCHPCLCSSCTFPSWHQCSLNARHSLTHLHYPSQKQWLPGMCGKQEPPRRAPPGAPTCSHPRGWAGPTTCWLKSFLSLRSSCRRARRRDPGKAKDSTFQGPSSYPRESPSTGFDFESTRSKHGKTCKGCIWLHVAPIRMSPWMTDDDPLTKFDNGAALSRRWSHREPRNWSGKFSSKTKGPTASISKVSLNRPKFFWRFHNIRSSSGTRRTPARTTWVSFSH